MNGVCVVGLGYVGLSTAVISASKGLNVIGVDIDKNKVEAVNSGRCYLREPRLDGLLRDAVSWGSPAWYPGGFRQGIWGCSKCLYLGL